MGLVFVVEAADDEAQQLARRVRIRGYNVDAYTVEVDALEAIKLSGPSLVMLNLTLPIFTGFEVAAFVRTFSEVPLVAVTQAVHAGGILDPFCDLLRKPVTEAALTRVLRHAE